MTNVTDIRTGLPVVAGVEIAVDEHGRFNLNAIHRASGLGKHKSPNKWLENAAARDLVVELETQTPNSGLAQKSVNVVKGGKAPGTFAHELLAISYAGWISAAFQLKVNQVFMDYRTGNLKAVEPSRKDLALMVIQAEEERERLTAELDEATRTKAWIGSKREATAMAKASAELRRANQLQQQLGVATDWKTVKAIPWLEDQFLISRSMYQQVGKKLRAISDELGLEVEAVEDSSYGTIKAYHISAINELGRRLMQDRELLGKYRKGEAA
ncbi:KilA-N domain-containing protein [Marinobacter sp. CA1]|uniref:KilA-N domain-containing protein n=1 Tax=Marinobacter sp. CA1 TaxID=2817656 RepID=UPI001D091790|nr:KilA-N domain-containing protein [Marinobacter sp. CA1]UDL03983.1 KilA-N domain-containing protein [Marinobacter sp. CA1]